MKCPKCDEPIFVFSYSETTCQNCGSKLISKNGKFVNIIFIVIWALIGRLIILNLLESVGLSITATILIATPILYFVRMTLVKYELAEI